MFSKLQGAVISLTSLVAVASATSSLSLKVTGPRGADTAKHRKIVSTTTNTGDKFLRVLNDPRGPLSKFATDTFSITNAAGAQPAFAGKKVKYVPSTAAAAGGYTTLAPGQSVKVEHDLAEAYDFTALGSGAYNITAKNPYYIFNPSDAKITPIYADSAPHSISSGETNNSM